MLESINTKTAPPFYVSAEDITWRMRHSWIEDLDNGYNPMIERVIPYLEMESIYRLKKELPELAHEWPALADAFESVRSWWLNEALQNCDTHTPIGKAGEHLSAIGQAAVNVLMAASELRDAINCKHAEKSAALGMLLICEAIAGGFSMEFSSLKNARENAYKNGAGDQADDFKIARRASIELAGRLWKEKPDLRIGEVAEEIGKRIEENKSKFLKLKTFPKVNTIKTWLREAAKGGKLAMPEGAQKHGRAAKKDK